MNLFDIQNNKLVYAPEALAIDPFKVLFERDKSKDKSKAIAELAALYYLVDYKSDFQNILDEKIRLKEIVSVLSDLGKDWTPDAEWMDAIEFYKSIQETPSLKLIKSAKVALHKIETFFNSIDLHQTDKSGKPKHNAKQLLETVNKVGDSLEALKKMEDLAKKEIEQKANKLRGGRDKGAFAD